MKKVFAILVSLSAFAIILSGCSKPAEETTGGTAGTAGATAGGATTGETK